MKRVLPFVIIAVVLAAGLLTVRYLQGSTSEVPPPSTAPPLTNAAPGANKTNPPNPGEPGAEPPHALGNANAPVTLEEFGDFECPPCGLLHPVLKMMESEFGPTKLRIIFREFPLVPTHQHALSAARAAEAAGLQGKFWEMHDMIYEHQKDWHGAFDVRPIFEDYATKIGLDVEQFRRDNTNEIVERRIFQDGKRGHSLGVTGTPTVFMNGREVPFESLAPDKLKALVNRELAAHP
ncbi:MAG TPA: thioredoxin domain-containing protein [Pyrinomonadaceae bacterium]|jgi:protein-disulfide isomerase|nr:thioredoxin domain-containing protein [Pyrinomonadaceae bacterium]